MALLRPLAVLLALPAAPGAGIEGLFAQLDVNANGYVSKLELRRGAAAVRELAGELAADEVFGAADADGNRMLSAEELGRFAASSAASAQAEPRRQPAAEPQALQRERPSFELHASCEPCVAAGFGWSLRLGKCGGFANKRCEGAPSSGDGLAEENRALQSELATALAFVDELLLDSEASGDGTGGDAAAKVARARQLLRERGAEGERCAAEPTATPERSRGWGEWRPSKGEVASFMPKISSFAWTPLWSAPTSNLDLAALRAHILKDRERNPGLQKSNDGGFHSEGDLLAPAAAAKTPVLKAFRNEIYRHVHAHLRSLAVATAAVGGPGETREDNRPYRIILGTAWYNFNRAGDYNNVHTHDGSHISGVLYIDDGGDPTACTKFYDVRGQRAEPPLGPRARRAAGRGGESTLFRPVWGGTNSPLEICPTAGTMVLFPAWLQHAVLPLASNETGTRLTVSWNLVLEERRAAGRGRAEPEDTTWPLSLSGSDDRQQAMALAGGEDQIPRWASPTGIVADLPPGVRRADGSAPRGLSLHWATPIRPNLMGHQFHEAGRQLRGSLLRLERQQREQGLGLSARLGWSKRGVLQRDSPAASGVRDGVLRELYWHLYEMLAPEHRRAPSDGGGGLAVEVELLDSVAHVLRPGEHILQASRGDAEICGLVSLDLGLKLGGRSEKNDMEIIDPRPMYSGTSSAYRGSDTHPASLYYWEMTNLGGRKLSFGLVPNLVVLLPCWLKYDIVPEPQPERRAKDAVRTLVSFAARVRLEAEAGGGGAGAEGEPPALRWKSDDAVDWVAPSTLVMPFPRPQRISAHGPPVQLARRVAVRGVGPVCDGQRDSLCSAIVARYTHLLQIKTSSNPDVEPARGISTVTVRVTSPSELLGPNTDESYNLTLANGAVVIQAATIFGGRHGLETLAQMVSDHPGRADTSQGPAPGSGWGGWIGANNIEVVDKPAFAYRGLLIDTGRHFLPVKTIKHIITGMAALRLSALHWHMIDEQSYPIQGDRVPELARETAFAPTAVYTPQDMREVVQFARARGVRVMPEVETPGHGTSRSKVFPQLNLSTCPDVLNPTINATYEFLVKTLSDVAPQFTEPVLFLGGDEVSASCYDSDPRVRRWMAANCEQLRCCGNVTSCSAQMLSYFFSRVATDVMPKLPVRRSMGVWLADHGFPRYPADDVIPGIDALPPDTLWMPYQNLQTAKQSLAANRDTVVTPAFGNVGSIKAEWAGKGGWYLDMKPIFEDAWKLDLCRDLECDAHPGWRERLLGGAACAWGDAFSGRVSSIDQDLFSGGLAAIAERLWSDPRCGTGQAPACDIAAADAKNRSHALACHWSLWGMPTFDRAPCADWPCSTPGGSLELTPVVMPFTCASSWSVVPE